MRFGRYEKNGRIFLGEPDGDVVYPLDGALTAPSRISGATPIDIRGTRLLSPVTPSKIIAIGPGHNNMLPAGRHAPDRPYLFFKPSSCITHPEDPIVFPSGVTNILYEMELAIVIGKTASRVSRGDALNYVAGYTCCNDVTAGHLEKDWGTQFSYHWKAFDTFGPIGPLVSTNMDVDGLSMISRLNGDVHVETTVSLIYSPADLVSWISSIMTLYPGDVIATGAAAQANLKPGDTCEIEIEGIGVLRNRVVSAL